MLRSHFHFYIVELSTIFKLNVTTKTDDKRLDISQVGCCPLDHHKIMVSGKLLLTQLMYPQYREYGLFSKLQCSLHFRKNLFRQYL